MQFNPFSIPIILGIGFLSFLMRLVVHRNRGRVVIAFTVFGSLVLLHGAFFSAYLIAANPTVQTLLFYLMVYSTMLIPVAVLFFVLEYFGYENWITWKSVSTLLFFPILSGVMALTDPIHGLFWEKVSIVAYNGFSYVQVTMGLIPILVTTYLYFILGISVALMFWGISHIPKQRRPEINILIVALSIPLLVDMVRTFDLNPWPHLYITPYGTLVSVILLSISIVRYDFLNAIPAAYSRLFSEVTDAILVFDHKLNLLDLNIAARQLFFSQEDARTMVFTKELPELLQQAIRNQDVEIALSTKDSIKYYDLERSEIAEKSGLLRSVVITLHDISLRKQTELQLQGLIEEKESLLGEKEVLLREINHRVKNNFNLAGSLLFLEAQKFKDKAVKNAFEVSRDRLRTMSLLNERLYRSDTFNNLDLGNYLCSIAEDLMSVLSSQQDQVKLHCNTDVVLVEPREAIPCGLIVNELVTNSLKYAFREKCERAPAIFIKLTQGKEGLIKLQVDDTGCGYPDSFDREKSDSLGLRLVYMLGQDQLGGSVNIGNEKGAFFSLSFFAEPEEA
ncbi:MAG: histidine kinase N-terminal 7TM domain-containing protein [Candidatus Marinimicrobia bacterium]|nr:histidine kinase N-terminal 7TM domain-containing protein [Candidatus Neomarinimicrobiota bacterium]